MIDLYYLYILQSKKSGNYYVGYSKDPWRRLQEHNTVDRDTFTSKHQPWSLKAVFEVGTNEGEALKIERFIKKQKSRVLLEKLTDPEFFPIRLLAQLVRVPHVRD